MYFPRIRAIRLLDTPTSRAPDDPVPYSEEWENALADSAENATEYFREELREFLGEISSQEAAQRRKDRRNPRRSFVREVRKGVLRLELRLSPDSELLSLVPEEDLIQAVYAGRLDVLRIYHGGFDGEEYTVDSRVLYALEKTRRFSVFKDEWLGNSSSRKFRAVLEELKEGAGMDSVFSTRVVEVQGSAQRRNFLQTCDEKLLPPLDEKLREILGEASIRWQDWRKAGRGLRSRLGFEKTYF